MSETPQLASVDADTLFLWRRQHTTQLNQSATEASLQLPNS